MNYKNNNNRTVNSSKIRLSEACIVSAFAPIFKWVTVYFVFLHTLCPDKK